MKKILKILLLAITFISCVFAQGSSIYSRYGLGDISGTFSTRRIGFGGLGIALADKHYLNDINPAGWNELSMTRFETGLVMDRLTVENSTQSSTTHEFTFSGLAIGIPIQRDYGLVLAGGLVPYSNVDYDISFIRSGDIAEDYTINYNGTGGISKFYLGLSYRLPFESSIGLAYEYYSGKIDYDSELQFADTTGFANGVYKKNNQYRGIGLNIGFISGNIAKLFENKEFNDFRIGFTYNKINPLKTDTTLFAISSLGSAILAHDLTETEIPDRFGFGASMRIFDDYTILFDYISQDWSDYSIGGKKSNYLGNFSKYSLGFEYKYNDVSRLTLSSEQIALRGGLSFGTSQYKFEGNEIDQFSLYAGLSYPLEFGSTIDIGLEYTKRGTTDNNLLKENIYKMYFSLSIGELWFVRQEK